MTTAPPAALRTGGLLTATGVSCSYAAGTPVVGPCDVCVATGEILAVVGPSGSGKTTLVKILAGLVPAETGQVHFDGRPLTAPSPQIGIVLQDYGLFPWRSTLRNVAFPLEVARTPRRERLDRARAALTRVGLADAADLFPHQLSGGMRQRAAIARALVSQPRALLLDEPMSALDVVTKRALQEQIGALVRGSGLTTVVVTHDLLDAVRMADRVVVVAGRPGRVVAEQVIDRTRPEQERVEAIVGCMSASARRTALLETDWS